MPIGIYIGTDKHSGSRYWKQQSKGLIFKTDFDDISSWVNDGTFSKVADDALISFDPLPITFPNARQPIALMENGTLYLFYDVLDSNATSTNNVYTKWANSPDGGNKTWTNLMRI